MKWSIDYIYAKKYQSKQCSLDKLRQLDNDQDNILLLKK